MTAQNAPQSTERCPSCGHFQLKRAEDGGVSIPSVQRTARSYGSKIELKKEKEYDD